jgi:cell wall-associated NlpC family hydrolase
MSRLGDSIAAEALQWVETPFKWGQAVKGEGCDCKGLIQGVARELDRPEADSFYATFSEYRVDRPVPSALLLEGFGKLFDRAVKIMPGDVLLLKHGGKPGHMAIAVDGDRAVHAIPGTSARVRSRDLSVLLHKFPLHSVWRFPRTPKCR